MLLQFILTLLMTILCIIAYFMLRYERKHGYPTAPTGSESSSTTKDES
jgi:cbb3-type cytochrome oxidase subunit 3